MVVVNIWITAMGMGVEFGTTGITSPEGLGLGMDGLARYDEAVAAANREVVWTDGRHRGFIRLEVEVIALVEVVR